jgi:hypothetical protein
VDEGEHGIHPFTKAASQALAVVYVTSVLVDVLVDVAVSVPPELLMEYPIKLPRHSGNSATVWYSLLPAVTPAKLCEPLAAEAGVVAMRTRNASFIS